MYCVSWIWEARRDDEEGEKNVVCDPSILYGYNYFIQWNLFTWNISSRGTNQKTHIRTNKHDYLQLIIIIHSVWVSGWICGDTKRANDREQKSAIYFSISLQSLLWVDFVPFWWKAKRDMRCVFTNTQTHALCEASFYLNLFRFLLWQFSPLTHKLHTRAIKGGGMSSG